MSAIREALDRLPFSRAALWIALVLILVLFQLTSNRGHERTMVEFESAIEQRIANVERSVDSLGIADQALLNCIRAAARDRSNIHPMNTGGIDDVRELTMLYCPSSDIGNIAGLSQLEKLKFLDLSSNRIESLAPLKGHPSLQRLQLVRNPVSDIQVAASLPQLQQIYLPDLPDEKCVDVEFLFSKVNSNAERIKCVGRQPTQSIAGRKNAPAEAREERKLYGKELTAAEHQELLRYEQNQRYGKN